MQSFLPAGQAEGAAGDSTGAAVGHTASGERVLVTSTVTVAGPYAGAVAAEAGTVEFLAAVDRMIGATE